METTYQSTSLDHLGLVAGMYDTLGIGDQIDKLLPQAADKRHVSLGTLVKALVINGLGFTQRTLYLTSSYFEGKPVERLFGPGVEAGMFNDSVLGRALDSLHAYGLTRLFSQISPVICSRLSLQPSALQFDSTTFHVDGQYNAQNAPSADSSVVHITRGYSRDHRPDLNQVVLQLMVDNQAGIPLFMAALSGNSSDKADFRQTIAQHLSQLQADFRSSSGLDESGQAFYLVMDSAGYSTETIALLGEQRWVSRVPETVKECAQFVQSEVVEWQELCAGYQYIALQQSYAGVAQRWLLISSAEAFEREVQTLRKNYAAAGEKETRNFQKLCQQPFDCEQDAQKALSQFLRKCKTIMLAPTDAPTILRKACFATPGRPAQDAQPSHYQYFVHGQVCSDIATYRAEERTKGRFVIASNECNTALLSDLQLLETYKGQAKVERGFRFCKDPQFVATSFFVKKVERLEALTFIMTLSLAVYAALEYRLRQLLVLHQLTLPNQLNKQVQNPTTRWVFTLFSNIHVLHMPHMNGGKTIILNLKEVHLKILDLFKGPIRQYYRADT